MISLRLSAIWLMALLLCLALAACAPTPQKDKQADKVDVVTLPKFGFDPHWGGRQIPEKIIAQRTELLSRLSEQGATPEEFSQEVTRSGWDSLTQSDYNTAIRRFNQAWLVHPQSGFAIMGMAMVVYDRDGDVKGGLMLMDSLKEPLGAEPTYWINRASMEKRANLPLEALKHFEIASQLAPNDPITVKSLIELYSASADFANACRMLTKARSLELPVDENLSRFIENNAQSSCKPS